VFSLERKAGEVFSIPAGEDGLPEGPRASRVATVTRRPSSKDGDHKNIVATMAVDPCPATTLAPASTRPSAPQGIDETSCFLANALSRGITVAKRGIPREGKDAIVARPRRTTAEKLRVVADAPREPALRTPPKPDPRLVNLVRLLARQAPRDFVQAETDSRKRDRLPE
jgi:hypothetical protein